MAAEKFKIMKYKADNSRGRENMNQLKLTNHILATPFQEMKLFRQIMLFVHQLMTNVNFQIGNVYCVSVLHVLILISHELK